MQIERQLKSSRAKAARCDRHGVDVGRRQPVPLTIGLGIAQKATDSASVAVTAGLASLAALWRCWLWLPALHARTSHRLAGKRA